MTGIMSSERNRSLARMVQSMAPPPGEACGTGKDGEHLMLMKNLLFPFPPAKWVVVRCLGGFVGPYKTKYFWNHGKARAYFDTLLPAGSYAWDESPTEKAIMSYALGEISMAEANRRCREQPSRNAEEGG
jgi:hypothetical protein